MKINESKGGTLHFTKSVIKNAKQSAGFLKDNLNTLNVEREQEEREQPERYIADSVQYPIQYLTRGKEEFGGQSVKGKGSQTFSPKRPEITGKAKIRRQSCTQNQVPVCGEMPTTAANKAAGMTDKATGITAKTAANKTAGTAGKTKRIWGSTAGNKVAGTAGKATGILGSTAGNKIAGTTGKATGVSASAVINTAADTAVNTAATAVADTAVNTAADMAVNTAAGAAAGAATGGVTVGIQSVKAVKNALIAKQVAARKQIGQLQEKMETVRSENESSAGMKQAMTYMGATAAVLFLAMLQMAASVMIGLLGMLVSVLLGLLLVVTLITAVISFVIALVSVDETSGAERIVQVALSQEDIADGTKYWQYTMGSSFVNGSATPWCASFVSWCANECGYIDGGIFPKTGAVGTYRRFYENKGLYHDKDGYVPKTGDLIIFSPSHIGIVQYVEGGRVVTIEGNTSDAVHTRSYELGSSYIVGYCTPEYPGEASIVIPDGMGIYHTYMGWHTITSTTSRQYQLREQSGENYDEEGFARIDGRYVIACTTTFGEVGDYIDFYRENGEVIHAVIGDIKNQNDPGCNEYGHADGTCVVEYVVSRSWYPSHPNPGTSGCHPEWNSRVTEAVNLGKNYFD